MTLNCLACQICYLRSKFHFKIRRDNEKKIIWAPRLGVGRRWEPILGYISKIEGKQNSGSKVLTPKFNVDPEVMLINSGHGSINPDHPVPAFNKLILNFFSLLQPSTYSFESKTHCYILQYSNLLPQHLTPFQHSLLHFIALFVATQLVV